MDELQPKPSTQLGEIPDPTGRIAKAVKAITRKSSVRQSPYCEWIIARRLAGDTYLELEAGLRQFGRQYRISASTIYRALKKAGLDQHVPHGVLVAEGFGGDQEIDAPREVRLQIISQKQRVNDLVTQEAKKKLLDPNYSDPRVGQEMGLLNDLFRTLKLLAATTKAPAGKNMADDEPALTEEEEIALADMIVDGKVTIPASRIIER